MPRLPLQRCSKGPELGCPVLILRPEPGCSATLAAARQAGLEAYGAPLFEIVPVKWDAPDSGSIDGILLGSVNALRHGGPQLAPYLGMAAHVVGEVTAAAARTAGFAVSTIGTGGLQAVLDQLAGQKLTLLRLAGAEHVAIRTPQDIRLITRIVYGSKALPLPPAIADVLGGGGVVLLHSAVAARHFAAECDRQGIDRSGIKLATLGPRIAVAAGQGWGSVRSAHAPDDSALLALAAELCQ